MKAGGRTRGGPAVRALRQGVRPLLWLPDPERVRQPRLALREGRRLEPGGRRLLCPLPWPLPRAERPRGWAHPFRGTGGAAASPKTRALCGRALSLPLAARPFPSLRLLLRFTPHSPSWRALAEHPPAVQQFLFWRSAPLPLGRTGGRTGTSISDAGLFPARVLLAGG